MKRTITLNIFIITLLFAQHPCSGTHAEFSASNKKDVDLGDRSFATACVLPKATTQLPSVITFSPSVFSELSSQAIQKFSAFTTTQWDNFFSQWAGQSVHLLHQIDRNVIFVQFTYYQFSSFRAYIASLEGYHEAMVILNRQIAQDPKLAYNLSHISTGRKTNAKDFIIGEAQKSALIVAKKHEEFVRAQQAAIIKQQQEVAQHKAQVLTTMKTQQEYDEGIVEKAKLIDNFQSEQDTKLLRQAHAIQQTDKENFAMSSEKYTLLDQTHTLLQTTPYTDIDILSECRGTATQKFVHKELITNLNRIACAQVQHRDNPMILHIAESVVEFTHLGIAYNNAGYIKQAVAISDLTAALADYGWALAQGIGDGVTNVAHSILHPVDTATNIACSAIFVSYHLGKVLYEVGNITGTYMVDPIAGIEKFKQCKQNITAIYREICEKYEKLSGPEIVKAATTIATEAWLTGKCLGAAKTFYGHAQTKALELVTKVDQGLATIPELLASAEGLEVLIANEAAETTALFSVKEGFNEGCRTKMLQATEDMTHYVEKFKKLGLNPISKRDLKHIFKNHMPGGQYAQIGERSIFYENVNIIDLAIQGWKDGTETVSGTKVFDIGKSIGLNMQGIPTSKISISLNGTKEAIKTIFPI